MPGASDSPSPHSPILFYQTNKNPRQQGSPDPHLLKALHAPTLLPGHSVPFHTHQALPVLTPHPCPGHSGTALPQLSHSHSWSCCTQEVSNSWDSCG